MNVKAYQAAIVRAVVSGGRLPTTQDIVKSIVQTQGPVKVEVIVDQVHVKTGIDKAEDLEGVIAHDLRSLEKHGAVRHTAHGIWEGV